MTYIQEMYQFKQFIREMEKLTVKCVHLKCADECVIRPD